MDLGSAENRGEAIMDARMIVLLTSTRLPNLSARTGIGSSHRTRRYAGAKVAY